ncbi:hypothetical protein [Nocardioides lijunqiniae]|uniref:hypothetical protein n=1 Tax=Nocardioides lijunqiniae TaxID=2760832 RepID=UPI0018778F7E|nr:hypothetical protein [Nocardioides lijunqiniae]
MIARTRLVLLVVGLVLLTASPATAGRWTAPDPAGDVTGWSFTPEPPPCGTYTDLDGSEVTQVDIRRLSLRHLRKEVRVRIHYRDLRATGELQVSVTLRTPKRDYSLSLIRWEDGKKPHVDLTGAPDLSDAEPDECGSIAYGSIGFGCRGLVGKARPGLDRVDFRVPRACLRQPRRARVAATTGGQVGDGWYSDTWAPAGVETDWRVPTFGRWVRAPR